MPKRRLTPDQLALINEVRKELRLAFLRNEGFGYTLSAATVRKAKKIK